MRVLLAFDKFKDSMTAREACDLAAHAIRAKHPEWTIDRCPLADGGEGFCEILTHAADGYLTASSVSGPLGDLVQAQLGFVPVKNIPAAARNLLRFSAEPPARVASPAAQAMPTVAVIEMATASGLALLEPEDRNPWQTSTFGTGELMRTAAELGATGILLGVGGSATNDLGLGALAALGLEFRTTEGDRVEMPIPEEWTRIADIGGRLLPGLPPVRIACDVTNPLLGAQGATAIYGPQKGLRSQDVARLDQECARLGRMLCARLGKPDTLMAAPGAGAAGGIAFGLMAATGAELLPGSDLVSTWLDLEGRLAAADLVLTGEGRFDDSSLSGKGPGALALRALALGKTVHVLAGQSAVTTLPPGLAVHAITPAGTGLSVALLAGRQNLVAAVSQLL